MRLCRRKSHFSQLHANMCCTCSCYSAVGAPYEEVVRYQRQPTDKHRLIVLVGMLCSALGVILDLVFCVDSNSKGGTLYRLSSRDVLKACLYVFIRELSKASFLCLVCFLFSFDLQLNMAYYDM